MIGICRTHREQVRLEFAAFVVIGQAGQEADKRLLHDVFTGGPVAKSAVNEREQAALVARDQERRAAGVALPNLLHQKPIAFGGHADSLPGLLTVFSCQFSVFSFQLLVASCQRT